MLSNYGEKYSASTIELIRSERLPFTRGAVAFWSSMIKETRRLAGPDSGLNKYDILREVMVQFRVYALRVKPSPDAKPPIV
jgi:hypothetical protein